MYNFDSHLMVPGQLAPVEEYVNPKGLTWSELGQLRFLPCQIDGAARDAGNTGYTDVLRQGLLLGKATGSKKFKQWSPSAIDGSGVIQGMLMHNLKMTYLGGDKDRFTGYVLFGGAIYAKSLLEASMTTPGIVGTASEYLIRAQMGRYFQFDDDPGGSLGGSGSGAGGVMILGDSAFTAHNLTLTAAHSGPLIVLRATTTAVKTLTLPATPLLGLRFKFYNASALGMKLIAGTADTMVVFNDLTADTVSLETAGEIIGGCFEVIGDGTGWLVIPMLWEAQTVTILTA